MYKFIVGYRKEEHTFFISSVTIDADSMEEALKIYRISNKENPEYIKQII